MFSGNTLYGTAYQGAGGGRGAIFSFTLGPIIAPALTILPGGANVVLTWPTNFVGYTLQATTNLVPVVTWNTVLPPPVVVNGLNTVTNAVAGTKTFYRLMQ
jgi:uncharacterized repeat protein (TIGR03803 family)